jgi:hypothetical protein
VAVPSAPKAINPRGVLPASTGLYNPKAFVTHAASHRHPFGHCGCLSTAASRRSLGRISIPVWPTILSDRLPIVALVGHYLTNKLMGRGLISERQRASRGHL